MPRFDANITLMFREYSLIERFEAARAAGFVAVELLTTESVPCNSLAKASRKADVEVVLCNTPMGDFVEGGPGLSAVPGRQAQFREAANQVSELVSLFGCPRVHIGPSRVPHGVSRDRCFETLVENLAYAADLLAIDGVQLLVEPLNKYDTSDIYLYDLNEALRVIAAADRPNVALQFDIYHQARMGMDIISQLQTHIDHIGHIQFADAPGRGEPGSGAIDFYAIFSEIDKLGYSGWLGAEYKPTGKTEDSLRWLTHYT